MAPRCLCQIFNGYDKKILFLSVLALPFQNRISETSIDSNDLDKQIEELARVNEEERNENYDPENDPHRGQGIQYIHTKLFLKVYRALSWICVEFFIKNFVGIPDNILSIW